MRSEFVFKNEMDEIFTVFTNLLNQYNKSEILQDYSIEFLESFLYATMINNFFLNLTANKIKKYGILSSNEFIKKNFEDVENDANSIIYSKINEKFMKLDANYYNNFRVRLKLESPKLLNLLNDIEEKINLYEGIRYIKQKKQEIKEYGQENEDLDSKIITKLLETYVYKNNRLPSDYDVDELKEGIPTKLIPDMAQIKFKTIIDNIQILDEEKEYEKEFEAVLYQKWREPLDLLNYLILFSLKSVNTHRIKIVEKGVSEDIKFEALIRIHARALQISKEIYSLLTAGYADGANARWRSLHELVIVSKFLADNDNYVSQRFVEHESIIRYKDAKDYQEYCIELGYEPYDKQVINELKKRKDDLCRKYDKDYHITWGWIPSNIIKRKTFRSLEKHVGLDKFHPFYNWSSANIHGNSRGLYRAGQTKNMDNKILMVGASDHGIADPLQNTAISIMQISNSFLAFKPDFESLIDMKILHYFLDEINKKTVNIQKETEKLSE